VSVERNDSVDIAIDGRVAVSLKVVEWKSLTTRTFAR
jgi:hypothetical protein